MLSPVSHHDMLDVVAQVHVHTCHQLCGADDWQCLDAAWNLQRMMHVQGLYLVSLDL
jgi:hypothetical protein